MRSCKERCNPTVTPTRSQASSAHLASKSTDDESLSGESQSFWQLSAAQPHSVTRPTESRVDTLQVRLAGSVDTPSRDVLPRPGTADGPGTPRASPSKCRGRTDRG